VRRQTIKALNNSYKKCVYTVLNSSKKKLFFTKQTAYDSYIFSVKLSSFLIIISIAGTILCSPVPKINALPGKYESRISFDRISQSKIMVLNNIISSSENSRELERRYTNAIQKIFYSGRQNDFRFCLTNGCIHHSEVDNEKDIQIKASDNLITQKEVLRVVTNEMIKYPAEFNAKALPRVMLIVRDINFSGIERGAINFDSNYKQVIILSDKYSNQDNYYANTFNHEIYHNLKRDELLTDFDINIRWKGLDPRPHQEKYESSYKSDASFNINDGYVSDYARSHIEEDQAEVYAFYVDKILSRQRSINSIEDDIVRKKLIFMDEIFLEKIMNTESRY
jgi:hypothetical protein